MKRQYQYTKIYGYEDSLVEWMNNWSPIIKVEHIIPNPKDLGFIVIYKYHRQIKEMKPTKEDYGDY